MGGSSSKTQSTTTLTSSAPWTPQATAVTNLLSASGKVFKNTLSNPGTYNPTYYPQNTVAPFSQSTLSALSGIENRAKAGSPLLKQAQQQTAALAGQDNYSKAILDQYLGGYASGSKLNSNPAMSALTNYQQFNALPQAQSIIGDTSGYNALPQAQQLIGSASSYNALPQAQSFLNNTVNSQAYGTGQGYLDSTASGNYLNSNPYLDKMFDSASEAVTRAFKNNAIPGADSAAVSAGRYGSNFHKQLRQDANETLTNSLEDLASNIYGSNYAQERQNQIAAGQYLTGVKESDLSRQAQAYSQLAQQAAADKAMQLGVNQGYANQAAADQAMRAGLNQQLAQQAATDKQSQLAALNNLGSLGSQAQQDQMYAATKIADSRLADLSTRLSTLQALPGLAQQDYADLAQLLNAGTARENQAQAQIDDEVARWNFNQQKPLEMLNSYLSLVGLQGWGNEGLTTQTTPYERNTAAGILGGISTGASLFKDPTNRALGAVGGGLLGGLF